MKSGEFFHNRTAANSPDMGKMLKLFTATCVHSEWIKDVLALNMNPKPEN